MNPEPVLKTGKLLRDKLVIEIEQEHLFLHGRHNDSMVRPCTGAERRVYHTSVFDRCLVKEKGYYTVSLDLCLYFEF